MLGTLNDKRRAEDKHLVLISGRGTNVFVFLTFLPVSCARKVSA
jgi:hypothetical protein